MDTAFTSFPGTNQVFSTQTSRHFGILGTPKRAGYPFYHLPKGSGVRATRCSMKSYRLSELSQAEIDGLKARPRIDFSSIFNVVKPIVNDVQSRGDTAVVDYTTKFDKVVLEKVVEPMSDFPEPEVRLLGDAWRDASFASVAENSATSLRLDLVVPQANPGRGPIMTVDEFETPSGMLLAANSS